MDDRVVLHVDMDAFFASVEVLDDPTLAGKPVIVGGSGQRGVVAACTYEARRFGVHSAMPSTIARRLCPQAVFLDGRYHRYIEESAKLHAIFDTVTPLVEGISIDEAFLDVSGALRLLGDGPAIARLIRARVGEDLGLTCSVGVASTKFVAKLASEQAKPRADLNGVRPGSGVFVVEPGTELAFLHPLPIRALWGVGPATGRRLDGIGVRTIGDLAALPVGTLERLLGAAQGSHLAALARGHDPRPVVPDREAKSIGHEETFPSDLHDRRELGQHLARMVDAVSTHVRDAHLSARTVTIKVRFGDFTMVTRSHSVAVPIDAAPAVGAVARALFESVDVSAGVRLVGVSLSGFADTGSGVQLSLLGEDEPDAEDADPTHGGWGETDDDVERLQRSWSGVTGAVDGIRSRFGRASVGPASLMGADGLRVRQRGDAQWGPQSPPGRGQPGGRGSVNAAGAPSQGPGASARGPGASPRGPGDAGPGPAPDADDESQS
ncbi:MAG: DNA polymerase IV [Acidimicrobiales bacterium]